MDEILAHIMIISSIIALLAASALTGYSLYHSLTVNKRQKTENGIPVSMIGWVTIGVLIVIALPTLLIGSFTDMCIITAIAMFFLATIAVIYGKYQSIIKRKHV